MNVIANISGTVTQVSQDWFAWFYERAPQETLITSSLQSVEADGAALIISDGIEGTFEFGEVTAQTQTNAIIIVEGIETQSSLESIIATGAAIAGVQSATSQARAGAVTAIGDESIMVSSGFSYRNQRFDGKIRLPTLISRAEAGEVVARGETIIHNKAQVISISGKSELTSLKARGVLDIEENDLILLLAA